MNSAARLFVVPVAVSLALLVAAAALAMAANRPPLIIGSPSASSPASTASAGVLTTGDATISLKPDLATVWVGVDSQQSTAVAAQSDLAAKAGKLIARVKALGVADADLNTTGYWIGPTYVPDGQTVSGYHAAETLQIKWHDVGNVGKTLDAIVQEGGATQISVGFGLADSKPAQAQARSQAIAEARAKAQAMADAAGVRLGSVVKVSDLSTSNQYPYGAYPATAGAAPSTQVPAGQVEVQVTVEVDFAIA